MPRNDHPFRQWAVDEMHLRQFAPVPQDCEIYQVVRLVDPKDREAEDALFSDRPAFVEWKLGQRYAIGRGECDVWFLWERHAEASTVTLIVPGSCSGEDKSQYLHWMEEWVGATIRATRVFVISDAAIMDEHLSRHGIDGTAMVCCDINADIRIWSQFNIHEDGYGRLLMSAGEVSDHERGRIVQRVQELGNYRNLAMMGFPLVREKSPQLDALEHRLTAHAERVAAASDGQQDDVLLQELADISANLELIRSATEFRLSATSAYAEIVEDRLKALDVKPVANYQDLTDFTERRLVPAARTCARFDQRMSRIAERITQVMHTLDVRIDTKIKAQNLLLTKSMDRSIQMQFRLQQLIEGLSVIAAAYYLVGLIGFAVKGASAFPGGSMADMVMGALTLPVIAIIYFAVHKWRGTMLKDQD